eukprot:3169438-Pleurochrysis_carterae.AAC.1
MERREASRRRPREVRRLTVQDSDKEESAVNLGGDDGTWHSALAEDDAYFPASRVSPRAEQAQFEKVATQGE